MKFKEGSSQKVRAKNDYKTEQESFWAGNLEMNILTGIWVINYWLLI